VRALVAYYSLTGYTRSLAEATVRALCGARTECGSPAAEAERAGSPAADCMSVESGLATAELLEVVPARAYSYFTAGVKGVTQAMAGTIVDLTSPVPEAESFDGLVVLSPTWGWMSSPPVRSFVAGLPDGEGRPAVVGVTHAGGPIGSVDRLAELVLERGYEVPERLSVFCYDKAAISEGAERAAAALMGDAAGRAQPSGARSARPR
jgi:hypothetical protein